MNRRHFLQTVGTAVPVAAATAWLARPTSDSGVHNERDAAERILDTRTINCSYIPYGNIFTKDPNTGKMAGIFYDLTEKMGALLELNVNWNVETTYATFAEDMKAGKCDIIGGGIWASPSRAKVANFSLPLFYSGLGFYVRSDDHRFDQSIDIINDPQFKIATIDGEMSHIVQRNDYPKASVVSLANNTDVSMLAENVATGKADATFMEKPLANLYLQKNPGRLRNVADAKPLRIFENTWAFAYGSDRLKTMLDTSIKTIASEGYIDRILEKYHEQDSYYRVRTPVG
jgi:polar amino acid transport system substrate-binding protein